ncbi:MAG: dihydroxyacetone kinase subunit DhaK, partial [Planctomycetia bacterium]|nr:dihydroxyacetone kinase subunit DhaK [Planctomycetia bacterium]
MKKLINRPGAVVEEMIGGLVAVYPGLAQLPGRAVVVRADAVEVRTRQVALISGGGSGHEPAHAGYVGRGMLNAAVAGDVFTSPTPDAVLAAIRAVTGPPGALLIVKNYTGDRLNFGLAAELARAEGLKVEVAVVADDVALAATAEVDHAGRRGLAGTVLVHKVAGAAAEAGRDLYEVAAEARAAAESVATMGVALSPCTLPAADTPGFSLGPDEVELGLGIHGEPGVRRAPMEPADALTDRLLGAVLADARHKPGDRVVLLVNNLGGTPAMEMAVVARRAVEHLEAKGLCVERAYLGTFLSALEMAGVSLSVLRVDDRRLSRLDASTDAPAWPNPGAVSRPRSPALP